MNRLKAPFPYFGAKWKIADQVWRRFGRVDTYVEPFFGSGAVLLARPQSFACREIVNDKDAFLSNFWRAVQHDPRAVARHADWPVNEVDLEARHKWLVQRERKRDFTERMKDDPYYFDAKTAGWWVWGISQWIGAGWCEGEWVGRGQDGTHGRGINTKIGKRPHLKVPDLVGKHLRLDHDRVFLRLSDRLRSTVVCSGDWSRVCNLKVYKSHGLTGVFLDPPYTAEANRTAKVYKEEDLEVGHKVCRWAVEHGSDPSVRIALCGYDGEYNFPDGWDCLDWTASGGMANFQRGKGLENKHRERIWFSPHCLGLVKRLL